MEWVQTVNQKKKTNHQLSIYCQFLFASKLTLEQFWATYSLFLACGIS